MWKNLGCLLVVVMLMAAVYLIVSATGIENP